MGQFGLSQKRTWGTLNGRWVSHDTRDEIVDYGQRWPENRIDFK